MEKANIVMCDWHPAQFGFTAEDLSVRLLDYDSLHDVQAGGLFKGEQCRLDHDKEHVSASKRACHAVE